jgi:plastocyanin
MIKTSKVPNTRKRMLHCALRVLAIGSFRWSLASFGAEFNVNIVNFAFSPSSVNISVNDSVTWTWVGSPHTTTSDTGLWDSGVFGTGHTFSRTFTSAGSFPFFCTVHPFMTGTISVVTPAPIRLSDAQQLSPTLFQFSYSAIMGLRYLVQRSTDLTHWTDLSTNTAAASSIIFQDRDTSQSPAFYRVGLLQNP